RVDRSAARDDAGHTARRHRDVPQQDAGVHREVVDALLRLFDEGVAVDLPREIFRPAADLLERLVDRHRADGDRRVAQDPRARAVGSPARTSVPCGPLASYTRSASPLVSAISRIGTRIPSGPST